MDSDILSLSVGGTVYTTTRATLRKYPRSMLGAMFSNSIPVKLDENGRVFIDCDGKMFRYVLNFLRYGELTLPEEFTQYNLLQVEADYYQIEPLIEAIRMKMLSKDTKENNEEQVIVKDKVETAQIWVIQDGVYAGPHNVYLCGNAYSLLKAPSTLSCLFDEETRTRLNMLKTQVPDIVEVIFMGSFNDKEFQEIIVAIMENMWIYNQDLSYSTRPCSRGFQYKFSYWSLAPEVQSFLQCRTNFK